jgi:hypothetical protein
MTDHKPHSTAPLPSQTSQGPNTCTASGPDGTNFSTSVNTQSLIYMVTDIVLPKVEYRQLGKSGLRVSVPIVWRTQSAF